VDTASVRAERDGAARFDRLVEQRSSLLAGTDWSAVDDGVSETLQALLAFMDADECSFFSSEERDGLWTVTHRAVRVGSPRPASVLASRDEMPWAWSRLVGQMTSVALEGLDELPLEAGADRRYLHRARVDAALYIPLVIEGKTRHALAVAHARPAREGTLQRFAPGLRLLGQVIASALERMRQGQALDRSHRGELDRARRFTLSVRDVLDDCLCVVDANGIVVQTSQAWRRLGAEVNAPEGVPVGGNLVLALETADAPHTETGAQVARGIKHVLALQVRQFELEFPRSTPMHPRWLLARARAFDFDGRRFAAIDYRDITGHRATAAELEGLRAHHWHSDRVTRTGVLIASLAHELCQPLAAILSNAQAGLRRIGNDRRSGADRRAHESEIAAILSDIVADDKRAVQVIESLRLMLRRQATARKPMDLCDIVHDVVGLLHTELVRQGVQLELPVGAVGSIALVDRAQIQQVLLNVVLNGVEAMQGVPEDQRRLRVNVVRTGRGDVHVSVSDAGVGFTQEQLERCFEAFWTTKLRGTGLGLAICHSIVSSHGGSMWVEPKEGPGTTLVVALPIHVPPAAPAEEESRP
jgi:signal transduction histidine kinase